MFKSKGQGQKFSTADMINHGMGGVMETASREITRLEGEIHKHVQFLQTQHMLPDYIKWADEWDRKRLAR